MYATVVYLYFYLMRCSFRFEKNNANCDCEMRSKECHSLKLLFLLIILSIQQLHRSALAQFICHSIVHPDSKYKTMIILIYQVRNSHPAIERTIRFSVFILRTRITKRENSL